MVNWAFKLSQQVRALAAKPELDLWNPHGGRRAGGSSSIPICFSLITHVQVLVGKLLSLTVKIQRGSLRQGVLGYGLVCTRSLAPGSSGSSAYLFHTFSWPPAMRMAFQGEGVCISIPSLNNCRVFMGHSVIVGFMHRVWENYGTHIVFCAMDIQSSYFCALELYSALLLPVVFTGKTHKLLSYVIIFPLWPWMMAIFTTRCFCLRPNCAEGKKKCLSNCRHRSRGFGIHT